MKMLDYFSVGMFGWCGFVWKVISFDFIQTSWWERNIRI